MKPINLLYLQKFFTLTDIYIFHVNALFPKTFPFAFVSSARSYVVRTQGLNSEVTRQSKASMQNEGIAAPKSALAQRRHTTTPKKRTQNPTQKTEHNNDEISLELRFPHKNVHLFIAGYSHV
ncbi:protein vein isoform X3 [Vespula maculifrons]|uniref:Protein vein isoform X3 n=1 Tax=Vespula maculifrons TaxID=7453 RepID=A0ABD2B122_VESMC